MNDARNTIDASDVAGRLDYVWNTLSDNMEGDSNTDELTCVIVHTGYHEGLTHCDIINTAVEHATNDGAEQEEAWNWANDALLSIYSWYTPDMCPMTSA